MESRSALFKPRLLAITPREVAELLLLQSNNTVESIDTHVLKPGHIVCIKTGEDASNTWLLERAPAPNQYYVYEVGGDCCIGLWTALSIAQGIEVRLIPRGRGEMPRDIPVVVEMEVLRPT